MILAVLSILIGLLTGFGAVQEFIVGGLINREGRPFIIGLIGIAVSVLFLISGAAMWRKWANARRWTIITAISSILFHVYAALPPQRTVSMVALIIGAGFGLILLTVTLMPNRKRSHSLTS